MFAKKYRHFGRLSLLLAWFFLCGGCASLKPSASETPPDYEGGFAISEESRDAIGTYGSILYFIGEFFAWR
jgi:hypothetical protein